MKTFNIQDMVVGGHYLTADSSEYLVECLAINPPGTPHGFYGVKVKYLETNSEDFWMESIFSNSSIYVEPVTDR